MAVAKRAKYSADPEMCLTKLEEMEKGEMTDFAFLVGPDNGEPQLLHCFKYDLMLASNYFKIILNSPHTVPVRIKNVEPRIFKEILKFIATHKMEAISSFEDALALYHAADEFVMETLKEYCQSEIEEYITYENVWQILNDKGDIPLLQSVCAKVLSSETRECLDHKNFLEASEKSMTFLLQLDVLNVKSEKELVDACLKLSKHKLNNGGAKCNLMKSALPHLRLFTLKIDEITADLNEHLTDAEGYYLIRRLVSKDLVAKKTIPKNLNLNTKPRHQLLCEAILNQKRQLNIITKSFDVISDPTKILKVSYNITRFQDTISVWLTTKRNVSLTGIVLLTPGNPALEFSTIECLDGSQSLESKETTEINWTVEISYGCPKKPVFSQKCKEVCKYFSSMNIKFDKNVAIPKGFAFQIDITQNARRGGAAVEKKNPHIVYHRMYSENEIKEMERAVNKSKSFSNLMLSTNKESGHKEVILRKLQFNQLSD